VTTCCGTMGEDRVIVTRNAEGEIAVLLNVCSHRGFEVCRADHGNTHSFKCPYHGWAFDTSGNLLGAPLDKEMYGNLGQIPVRPAEGAGTSVRRYRVRNLRHVERHAGGLVRPGGLVPYERSGNCTPSPPRLADSVSRECELENLHGHGLGDDYPPPGDPTPRPVTEMGIFQLPGAPGSKMTLTGHEHRPGHQCAR